jgi:hypothetical protein
LHEEFNRCPFLERRHLPDRFTGKAQRFATCGQDLKTGTLLEELFQRRRRTRQYLFAVVHHEQCSQLLQLFCQRLDHRPTKFLTQPEHTGDRMGNQISIGDRPQLDIPDSVDKLFECFRAGLPCKSSLAAPSRPVNVTRLLAVKALRTEPRSRGRPTRLASWFGKFVGPLPVKPDGAL